MRLVLILLIIASLNLAAQAIENTTLENENTIQTRVDRIGTTLLNKNKTDKRIVFTYNKQTKKKALSADKSISNRQVVIYDGLYQSIQTDDELAAMLSREISTVLKAYNGIIDSAQVTLGAKKFETVADKRAVDYMVNAGYNPLALIVFINKTCPQKRFDRFSRHNLTSKRLAKIYEYITYKYPQYLENHEYINNQYYQNFLLTSIENRKKLDEKIKTKSTKEIDYE